MRAKRWMALTSMVAINRKRYCLKNVSLIEGFHLHGVTQLNWIFVRDQILNHAASEALSRIDHTDGANELVTAAHLKRHAHFDTLLGAQVDHNAADLRLYGADLPVHQVGAAFGGLCRLIEHCSPDCFGEDFIHSLQLSVENDLGFGIDLGGQAGS